MSSLCPTQCRPHTRPGQQAKAQRTLPVDPDLSPPESALGPSPPTHLQNVTSPRLPCCSGAELELKASSFKPGAFHLASLLTLPWGGPAQKLKQAMKLTAVSHCLPSRQLRVKPSAPGELGSGLGTHSHSSAQLAGPQRGGEVREGGRNVTRSRG